MYFDPGRSSLPQRENRYTAQGDADGHAPPFSTTTLLPLRHRNCARDISATLTASVVEYRQPQWMTPLGKPLWALSSAPNPTAAATGVERRSGGSRSGAPHAYGISSKCPAAFAAARTLSYRGGGSASAARSTETTHHSFPNVVQEPFASVHMEASSISAAEPPQRDHKSMGRHLRGERAGGATAIAGWPSGSSPSPRSTTNDRQSHRGCGVVQVRPGCTTSTERARYRNHVTRKLIDLYDEVAELYDCRENMRSQVTQAMRTDPRYCKERHGEVRLTCEPTPQQQSAVQSVEDALEVLHYAVHELVATYLTPEEKRYIGIDTHLFQTNTEKASTYQYAPPPPKPQSSSRSASRRAREKISVAASSSPLPSTDHCEVRGAQKEGDEAALEREAHVYTVAAAPTPAASTRTASLDTSAPPPPPLPQQQPLTTATANNGIRKVGDSWVPEFSAASLSAGVSLLALPVKLAQQSATEFFPLEVQPEQATSSPRPLHPSPVHVAAPAKHESDSGTVAELKPVSFSHTKGAEMDEGTPERVLASVTSASTSSSACPTGPGSGSRPHPPTRPQPPLATAPLVKVPVRCPDGQVPTKKMSPEISPGVKSVQAQVQAPALTAANPTQLPSHLPDRTASATSCNNASAANASERPTQAALSRFKRLLIDSDSDSSL
ncbi:hypothetical protein, conserved [Leishmania tarentolae]|uniref:Uncharacterized protein n=1 Tax=Leishmania tarentolae TaxID=5689 RepID=A0A640K8B6_LEITA|nr:hypothetical protein, conserved [Leishmania tarentolae]